MTVTSARKLSEIAEKIASGADPRRTIIDGIGYKAISEFEPTLNYVLVGTYVRSEKTKSGIIKGGDRTRAEDRFQGKIGLVLKLGPSVNAADRKPLFGGHHDFAKLTVGDWVMYRTSDANEFFFVDAKHELEGSSARVIEDVLIMARVADPESIY
jgi:co-chaperonin GroES (HSP10)